MLPEPVLKSLHDRTALLRVRALAGRSSVYPSGRRTSGEARTARPKGHGVTYRVLRLLGGTVGEAAHFDFHAMFMSSITPTIFLDFDGTITRRDAIDAILDAYADPQWLDIEDAWKSGRIGSRECLR